MDRKTVEDSLILMTLTGSYSYGINTESSDLDYKGICIAPKEYYLGLLNFEQKDSGWDEEGNGLFPYLNGNKDTVVYELKKYFNLATKCNPNILELLFEDLEFYTYVNDLGQKLIDNRDLFLTKKAKHTYSGYAYAQLKKIKSHRKWLLDPPKEKPIVEDFGITNNQLLQKRDEKAFLEYLWTLSKDRIEFFEENKALYELINGSIDYKGIIINNPIPEELLGYVQKTTNASDEFMSLLTKTQQYRKALNRWKSYQSWKKNRNPSRAKLEAKCGFDGKHAAHCVRLLRTGNEVLNTGKLNVNRKYIDAEELLDIRLGNMSYDYVMELAEKLFDDLEKSYNNSKLPEKPNTKKINQLFMDMAVDYYERTLYDSFIDRGKEKRI